MLRLISELCQSLSSIKYVYMGEDYGLGEIIQRIRSTRASMGISQMELAQMADMSQSFLASVEAGKKQPSVMTLLRIAKALGINPASFFPRDFKNKKEVKQEIINLLENL